MNELEFTKKISNMSEKTLECVEDRIYNDCVYYNDCTFCPHKFEIYESCHCKLNAITMFKRRKNNERKTSSKTDY